MRFGFTGIFDTLLADAIHLFVHFGTMKVSILTGTWNIHPSLFVCQMTCGSQKLHDAREKQAQKLASAHEMANNGILACDDDDESIFVSWKSGTIYG